MLTKITTKQIGGDDGYQWCVLVNGRVKWNGMTRSEAEWRAKRERGALPANQLSTIFRDHRCSRCRNGELPCTNAVPGNCGNPIAKND